MVRKHRLNSGSPAAAAVGFFLMVTTICAIAAPSSPIQPTEQRNAAVGFAITSWMINADALGKFCSHLGSKSDARFLEVLNAWKKRNSPYVNAALEYMADLEDRIKSSEGEPARQSFRNSRTAEFVNSTHKAEAIWFPDGNPDERSCQHMASFVADGSLDLDKDREFFPVLQDLELRMAEKHGKP